MMPRPPLPKTRCTSRSLVWHDCIIPISAYWIRESGTVEAWRGYRCFPEGLLKELHLVKETTHGGEVLLIPVGHSLHDQAKSHAQSKVEHRMKQDLEAALQDAEALRAELAEEREKNEKTIHLHHYHHFPEVPAPLTSPPSRANPYLPIPLPRVAEESAAAFISIPEEW